MLAYNPPEADTELMSVSPISPVAPDATEVEFSVVRKDIVVVTRVQRERILAQISSVERESMMPRAVREDLRYRLEAKILTAGGTPSADPVYRKVDAVEQVVVGLRAQLLSLL